MGKRKNNRQKMETYRDILTKIVKDANIKPMETLKRIGEDRSLIKTEWERRIE